MKTKWITRLRIIHFRGDSHTNYTYFRHKKQSKNTENGKKQKIYNPDEISPFASFIPML